MPRRAATNVCAPRIDNLEQRRKFLADVSVIAVVPARYASSRLPAKALAEIAGVPMVIRVWRQASKAKSVARVIVAGFPPSLFRTIPARSNSSRCSALSMTRPLPFMAYRQVLWIRSDCKLLMQEKFGDWEKQNGKDFWSGIDGR